MNAAHLTPQRTGTDHADPDVLARRIGAVVLIVLTVAVLCAELVGATGTWRLALTTAFVIVAPGWAVVAYARSAPLSFQWGVGVAVSVAIGIVVAQGMVLLHVWHPAVAVVVLGVLTLAALVHHLLRGRGARVPEAVA
jgi:hypothetical protein